jgi:hypothetical protein
VLDRRDIAANEFEQESEMRDHSSMGCSRKLDAAAGRADRVKLY